MVRVDNDTTVVYSESIRGAFASLILLFVGAYFSAAVIGNHRAILPFLIISFTISAAIVSQYPKTTLALTAHGLRCVRGRSVFEAAWEHRPVIRVEAGRGGNVSHLFIIETAFGKTSIIDGRRVRLVHGSGNPWVVAEISRRTGIEPRFGSVEVRGSGVYLMVISALSLIVWLYSLLLLAPGHI